MFLQGCDCPSRVGKSASIDPLEAMLDARLRWLTMAELQKELVEAKAAVMKYGSKSDMWYQSRVSAIEKEIARRNDGGKPGPRPPTGSDIDKPEPGTTPQLPIGPQPQKPAVKPSQVVAKKTTVVPVVLVSALALAAGGALTWWFLRK